jgi:hypothetical protein
VLSSQYARCLDTAKLAFGQPREDPALNSAVADPAQRKAQIETAKSIIARHGGAKNLVLVTHSVNIADVTGIAVEMGEFLVLTPDGKGAFAVSGRMLVLEKEDKSR